MRYPLHLFTVYDDISNNLLVYTEIF